MKNVIDEYSVLWQACNDLLRTLTHVLLEKWGHPPWVFCRCFQVFCLELLRVQILAFSGAIVRNNTAILVSVHYLFFLNFFQLKWSCASLHFKKIIKYCLHLHEKRGWNLTSVGGLFLMPMHMHNFCWPYCKLCLHVEKSTDFLAGDNSFVLYKVFHKANQLIFLLPCFF